MPTSLVAELSTASHPEILVLARREVQVLLPSISQQLDLVEQTYIEMAQGGVELPPKPGIHPRKNAFIHAMPAYLRSLDVAALKWVAGYPSNKERGLPYISGVVVLNDADTGLPLAVMDAAEITAARTAAASGVCVRRFAPQEWRRVAILGCGEQGRYHARVIMEVNPAATISAYDVDPARARSLNGAVEVAATAQAAVEGAEIVITAGPIVESPAPVISNDWLVARHLLLPIDFDFYVQPGPIQAADLFAVDDVEQFDYYRDQGHFQGWRDPDASTGEALISAGDYGRVACVNLGVGALDAAFAAYVYSAAAETEAGVRLRL